MSKIYKKLYKREIIFDKVMNRDAKIERQKVKLSKKDFKKYKEARIKGHENKVCPKCNAVFLAHHHITCVYINSNQCPIINK